MGGEEAMKKLLVMDPEVRGIVSSGYTDDPTMKDFKAYGFRGAVAKPYNLHELRETLKEVVKDEKEIEG